jgi:hypothetical protein
MKTKTAFTDRNRQRHAATFRKLHLRPAPNRRRARVVWDAQAFYVGFDADDADINARFEQRDDPTCFEMNARGVLYDYLNYNSRTLFKRWDATGVKIGVSLRGTMNNQSDTDKGWSLEAAIPWANFEELSRRPPVAGTVWKANFNRWDGVRPNRRMSIWSDPQNAESGRTCRRGSGNSHS